MSDCMDKRWYILKTLTGQEQKVQMLIEAKAGEQKQCDLRPYIGQIVVPTHKVNTTISKRNKATGQETKVSRLVSRKIFPGYVFIELALYKDSSFKKVNQLLWDFINGIEGVTGFLGAQRNMRRELVRPPLPLTPAEVANTPGLSGAPVKVSQTVSFEPGETVRIINGAFADNVGVVQEVDRERGRIQVLVSIFGGETPVDLQFQEVERYVETPKEEEPVVERIGPLF